MLNQGFKNAAVKKTGVNAAVAEIIENGLTATSPYQINYPNMLISKGSLTGAMNGGVTGGSASVTIDWDDNTSSGNAADTDKAIILVYNPGEVSIRVYDAGGGPQFNDAKYGPAYEFCN